MRLHAQVNWEGNIDDRGEVSPRPRRAAPGRGLGAARIGRQRRDGWAVLAGVSNPPFSLEHTGPAWTPRYTLTPSALNTWLWEEGRVLGLEGEWWTTTANETRARRVRRLRVGTRSAGHPAGAARLGAERLAGGHEQHDAAAGAGGTTNEFDERDGRPALYVGGNVRDPWKIGELRAGYFDNLGNLAVKGVWETRYATVGVAAAAAAGSRHDRSST